MALYSFLTGKIRVLEKNLLDQTDVDRLIDAPNFPDAFKALNDTDYGAHLLDVEPHAFRDALNAELQHVRDLMITWVDNAALLEFMFLQFDAHNIKLMLKTQRMNSDLERMAQHTSPSGLTAPETLQQRIIDEQRITMHPTTEALLEAVHEELNDDADADGFTIDSVVDRALFSMLEERVGNAKSKIVKELFAIQKETAAVKTFIRAKVMGLPLQDIAASLSEEFASRYEEELDLAVEQLPVDVRIQKAMKRYLEHKRLWELEKELEEVELDVIRASKWSTDGLEPVVGYFYAKNNAARNVRLILTAKQNDIPVEDIKPRVRALY